MKIIPLSKLIFFLVISFGVFYILEYGFNFDSWKRLAQPALLSVLTTLIFFKPYFRRYTLYLISICFTLMILASLLNLLNFSNVMADFGFSLLVVTIILYLPQIIKKGYIEKF